MIVAPTYQKELYEAANSISDAQWIIGDVANRVMTDYLEDPIPNTEQYQVWSEVGRYCRRSAGRVRKIAQVSYFYADETRKKYPYDFGYFERSMNFEEPEQAMEFLKWHQEEKGELLSIAAFAFTYQTHILGKELPEPPKTDVWDRLLEAVNAALLQPIPGGAHSERLLYACRIIRETLPKALREWRVGTERITEEEERQPVFEGQPFYESQNEGVSV